MNAKGKIISDKRGSRNNSGGIARAMASGPVRGRESP